MLHLTGTRTSACLKERVVDRLGVRDAVNHAPVTLSFDVSFFLATRCFKCCFSVVEFLLKYRVRLNCVP